MTKIEILDILICWIENKKIAIYKNRDEDLIDKWKSNPLINLIKDEHYFFFILIKFENLQSDLFILNDFASEEHTSLLEKFNNELKNIQNDIRLKIRNEKINRALYD